MSLGAPGGIGAEQFDRRIMVSMMRNGNLDLRVDLGTFIKDHGYVYVVIKAI